MTVVEGTAAPGFTLTAHDGTPWSLEQQHGAPVVLYFYPRDATSGCTAQACDVRDRWPEIAAVEAVVVGISPDGAESHRAFRADHDLPQTLLVDADRAVLQAYGAWGTKVKDGHSVQGVIRSSVVIDSDGIVLAVRSPIDPADQAQFALAALGRD
jgi:thioredoxin-dependent peroxiredoxin